MAKQREVEQWITINGVHVPVFKGESKADAAKNFKEKVGKRNAKQPMTKAGKEAVKKEYTNARNAEHSNKDPEKADAKRVRYEKAKDKYSQSKQQGTIKSVKTNKTIQTQESKLDPDRRKALDVTRNAEAKDKYGKDWYGLNDKQKAEIDRQLEKNHPDWYGRQASKDNDVIQEIRYKGEISRKDENGEWKVVGHYDNNKQAKTSTDNVTAAKTHQDLTDKLNKNGLKLDAADAHTMENSNSLNGEKVTMYDKDGNEYRGTYNKYSDGGREIVNIKKTADSPRKIANDNEDLKEKQIARNKAEAENASAKSDYIISRNSDGQELKIPRKTYEDRLERLKQYKQDLYDTANRPHSRYKLDPDHLRHVDKQIKDIEDKLKTGKDEGTVDAISFRDDMVKQSGMTSGQATMKMKKEMGFTDKDFVVKGGKQKGAEGYAQSQGKSVDQLAKELRDLNDKKVNNTINEMMDKGTSFNDAVAIAHKQYIGDKKASTERLPKYSNEKGVILNSTVQADSRYANVRSAFDQFKHTTKNYKTGETTERGSGYLADDFLRHIMKDEEQGKTSGSMYVNVWGEEKLADKMKAYRAAFKAAGYRVSKSENNNVHRGGYYGGRGKYVYASTDRARTLHYEKIEDKKKKR